MASKYAELQNNLNIIKKSKSIQDISVDKGKLITNIDNGSINETEFIVYYTFNEILHMIEENEIPYHNKYKLVDDLESVFNKYYNYSHNHIKKGILDTINSRICNLLIRYNENNCIDYLCRIMYNFINDFKEIRRDNLYHISNDIWGTIIHKLNNNRTSNNDLIDSILHSSSDEIDTDFSGSGSGSEC